MAKQKSKFSWGSFFLGIIVAMIFMDDDDQRPSDQGHPGNPGHQVAQPVSPSQPIQKSDLTNRFRTASLFLSSDEESQRLSGLRKVEEVARLSPAHYYADTRDLLASFIQERLQGGFTTEDESLRLAITTLINLRARTRPPNIAATYDVDLSEMDLRGLDLEQVDAIGVDFSGADLRGVNISRGSFNSCDFSDVDFEGADLTWTSIVDSDLSGADLSSATLSEAKLTRCKLSKGYFAETDLNRTQFQETDLSEALKLTPSQLARACFDRSVYLGGYDSWYAGVPNHCPPHYHY